MSIHRLTNLANLKHFSEYTVGELITSFGLYQKAIINLKDIRIHEEDDDNEGYVLVSKDVERLNELIASKNNIMLPCADCGKEQPFNPLKWGNPRKLNEPVTHGKVRSWTQSVFDISAPDYQIGRNVLNQWGLEDSEKAKTEHIFDEYMRRCVYDCQNTILTFANEVRKEYCCAYRNHHRVFVQFRIFDPIEPEDIEESSTIICSENVNDQRAYEAYEYLRDCLIIQKVGQYPSIADMQLFDISKYRKLLGKESYSDFTKAIGLYANGIGCGSFLYLRRIFERLIEEKHQVGVAAETENWNEEEYSKLRTNEKIDFLEKKGYSIIPQELSEIKSSLYGALSKGVHESTDDTCYELFPWLKFAIESILDEQIKQKEREAKLKELKAKIGKI